MKITFLSAHYPPENLGGGELSTETIAMGLAERGHDVTVLTGSPADNVEERGRLRIVRSSALHGLWSKPLFERRLSRSLLRSLRRLVPSDAEILHAHDFRSALLLSLFTQHTARVVTVRDFAPICGTTNNMWWNGTSCPACTWTNVTQRCHRVVEASPLRKPFRVWQYKYNLPFRGEAYRAIAHHIYISEALRARVGTRLQIPEGSTVIPNPVGNEWLSPPRDIRETDQRIVFAGTVESYKGIPILLAALAELRKSTPNVCAEILGRGDLQHVERDIADAGLADVVLLRGRVSPSDVREAFDRARVVVQPSLWEEPFGRTVIEAAARARPVVASRTGGLQEIITDEMGTLVPPGESSALAQAVRVFLDDPEHAKRSGDAGRAVISARYTEAVIAQRYESYYLETVLRSSAVV